MFLYIYPTATIVSIWQIWVLLLWSLYLLLYKTGLYSILQLELAFRYIFESDERYNQILFYIREIWFFDRFHKNGSRESSLSNESISRELGVGW